ncbi:(R)-specific enoyl-CoA hydratase [Terasakiella brassicae]|uniref:(R)-specific enoyl-CoA hydratase n=1 Tax=Terasakiella brassicae TaxID=1634917 RepID=A0A917BU52_9PROT|nr:MaoC family dehydratase [Terasakiella brassicae]GGF55985.1 (R)-specific enoyl-CoA hydratase [Terasakiella brassicae]
MNDIPVHIQEQFGYCFEDIEVGMSASFGKTVTEADINMFAGVSGDTCPIHLNEDFAKYTRFKTRIAHGFISASLISTLVGCRLPGPGALYVNQEIKFRKPVFIGDAVNARVVVRKLIPEKNFVELDTTCEVDGEVVVEGFATTWVPSRGQKD